MAVKVTTIIALVVAFVTFLLMSIATGSTYWMKAGSSHSGRTNRTLKRGGFMVDGGAKSGFFVRNYKTP